VDWTKLAWEIQRPVMDSCEHVKYSSGSTRGKGTVVHCPRSYGIWGEGGAKVWLHLRLHVRSLSWFIYIRTVEALESKDICAFHFHERDETLYLRHEH
jgi:hypothetical protein